MPVFKFNVSAIHSNKWIEILQNFLSTIAMYSISREKTFFKVKFSLNSDAKTIKGSLIFYKIVSVRFYLMTLEVKILARIFLSSFF